MCGLAVKINKLRHMEYSIRNTAYKIRPVLLFNLKSYFLQYKSSKRLLFSLLSINKCYTTTYYKFFNIYTLKSFFSLLIINSTKPFAAIRFIRFPYQHWRLWINMLLNVNVAELRLNSLYKKQSFIRNIGNKCK